MPTRPLRACAYLRVSTSEQSDAGFSLDSQRHRCEQAALAAGASAIEVFSDEGFSGSSATKRPALQSLLSRLDEFDLLVVWRLDRLSRSLRDTTQMIADLADHGVRLLSVTEHLDLSSAMGRAMAGVMAVFAELFLDVLRENVRAALAERVRQGKHHGQAPLGYRLGKDGLLVADPKGAPLIRDLFARYAGGEPLISLLRSWVGHDRRGVRGGALTTAALRYMLANPTYSGRVVYRGEVFDGVHEPLVDDRTWRTVQARLEANRRVPASSRNRSLASLLRCGICGGPCMKQDTQYVCVGRQNAAPAERHEPIFCPVAKTEAVIWAVVEWAVTEEVLAKAVRRAKAMAVTKRADTRRANLQEERRQLEEGLGYNLRAAREGAVDIALLARENAPLLARRDELDRALADLPTVPDLRGLDRLTVRKVLRAARADYETQRRFLDQVFARVELLRGALRFVHVVEVEALVVKLPKYWAPKRGKQVVDLEELLD